MAHWAVVVPGRAGFGVCTRQGKARQGGKVVFVWANTAMYVSQPHVPESTTEKLRASFVVIFQTQSATTYLAYATPSTQLVYSLFLHTLNTTSITPWETGKHI